MKRKIDVINSRASGKVAFCMRPIEILLLIVVCFSLITGCGSGGEKDSYPSIVAQADDWVYYVKDSSIYKMNSDWTEKTKIADNAQAQLMIVQGEYIYYADMNMNLFRMKTDGSGNSKILSEGKMMSDVVVADDWIYYFTKSNSTMFKVKTDGTKNTKIAEINNFVGNFKVSGDWIYYVVEKSIFKMKTDGTGSVKVIDGSAGAMDVKDGWIYFSEQTGEKTQALARIKSDGTEKTKLKDNSSFISIDGDWLYFSKDSSTYKSKLDGSDETLLNSTKMWSLIGIWGNYIYYKEYEGPVYRINLDGSNKVELQ